MGVEKEGLLLFKCFFSPHHVPVLLSVWLRRFPRAATSRVWAPTTSPFSSRWAGNFRKKLTALVEPSHISHLRVPLGQGEILIFNVCSDLSQIPHALFRKGELLFWKLVLKLSSWKMLLETTIPDRILSVEWYFHELLNSTEEDTAPVLSLTSAICPGFTGVMCCMYSTVCITPY